MQKDFSMNGRRASQVGMGMMLVALLAAMLVPSGRILAQEKKDKPAGKTLYERMGGYDVIAEIVTDFVEQLGKDEAFKRFGGGRSHNSLVRTKQLVIDQICNLSGGPCDYIGRDMKTAHEGLAITNEEWDSSIKKFENSLDKFKIKEPEHKEFIAMLQKLKPDIAEKPGYDKPKAEAPKTQN